MEVRGSKVVPWPRRWGWWGIRGRLQAHSAILRVITKWLALGMSEMEGAGKNRARAGMRGPSDSLFLLPHASVHIFKPCPHSRTAFLTPHYTYSPHYFLLSMANLDPFPSLAPGFIQNPSHL